MLLPYCIPKSPSPEGVGFLLFLRIEYVIVSRRHVIAEILVADDLAVIDEHDEAVVIVTAAVAGAKVSDIRTGGGHARPKGKINGHYIRLGVSLLCVFHGL
jgi:hypothetical protein